MMGGNRIATYNARGLQSPHAFRCFLDAMIRWTRRRRVSAVVVQEHNLHPSREGELVRMCMEHGWTLTVGFAPASPDGVHRGGVLLLTCDAELACKGVTECSSDLVRIRAEAGGKELDIAGVYVPAQPQARLAMLAGLGARLSERTIVGGDWNCVPDVTVDVQSQDPLGYSNIGAAALTAAVDALHLYDVRREQLGLAHEPTRVGAATANAPACKTRLDRWYVPTHDDVAYILWDVSVADDLVWKDCPSDHYVVILNMEITQGERGHERKTVREDLIQSTDVQRQVMDAVNESYRLPGSLEDKWTRGMNMTRHVLLKLTDAARKRDEPRIRKLRMEIEIIRKLSSRQAPNPRHAEVRDALHKELRALERPEIKPDDHTQAKRMADMSDRCTSAMFKSYKTSAKQQWINEMKVALEWKDGEEPAFSGSTQTPKQVAQEVKKYYEMLFAEKQHDEVEMEAIMEVMRKRKITSASRDALELPITDGEVQGVMERLPTGKQPGPDRIPNAVYKYMSTFFAPKLGAMLRHAAARGKLPDTLRKGDIGLIHKKGDRDEIRNYRPITRCCRTRTKFSRGYSQPDWPKWSMSSCRKPKKGSCRTRSYRTARPCSTL